MSSAAGTTILQDDGTVTLDEDGAELVSDGASDCDCCGPATPDCCTSNGCCFDLANARFRYHLYWRRDYYASLDGSGPIVHTFIFEADMDIQIYGCAFSLQYVLEDTPNNPDGSPVLSNVTCTWDGVALEVPGVDPVVVGQLIENIAIWVVAPDLNSAWDGSAWHLYFFFNTDAGVLDADYLPPLTGSVGGDVWNLLGTSDGFPSYSSYAGNCTGIPLTVVDPVTAASVSNTYSVTTNVTIEMTVENNYCCKDGGGDCVPSGSANTHEDGSC